MPRGCIKFEKQWSHCHHRDFPTLAPALQWWLSSAGQQPRPRRASTQIRWFNESCARESGCRWLHKCERLRGVVPRIYIYIYIALSRLLFSFFSPENCLGARARAKLQGYGFEVRIDVCTMSREEWRRFRVVGIFSVFDTAAVFVCQWPRIKYCRSCIIVSFVCPKPLIFTWR